MGSSSRFNPWPRSAASLLVTAAMVTTVGGTDVVERHVIAAQAERMPVSAMRTDVVSTEPLVTFGQQVQSRVVIRPVKSQVDAKGKDLWQISEVGTHDVPAAAMRAYRTAASTMRLMEPACDISWTLLAGIGRVESDHGRYGGSVLGSDGLPRPAIRGVALNGVGPVAAIRDSDNGHFDGDKVWDRAVGPMQFIPTTWAFAGRDGDRDGAANPNDIDDAALAAADYLCPEGTTSGVEDWRAQIFRYNHSDYYVDLVLAFERGYRTGTFVIPSPPAPPAPAPPATSGQRHPRKASGSPAPAPSPSTPGTPKPSAPKPSAPKPSSPKPAPTPQPPAPTQPPKPTPPPKPPKPTPPPKPPKPTPTPTPTPTPPPAPEFTQTSGQLAACGSGWCVNGKQLNFGSASAAAKSDFDGDGATESNLDELTGLEGATVTVKYRVEGLLVVELQGRAY